MRESAVASVGNALLLIHIGNGLCLSGMYQEIASIGLCLFLLLGDDGFGEVGAVVGGARAVDGDLADGVLELFEVLDRPATSCVLFLHFQLTLVFTS